MTPKTTTQFSCSRLTFFTLRHSPYALDHKGCFRVYSAILNRISIVRALFRVCHIESWHDAMVEYEAWNE